MLKPSAPPVKIAVFDLNNGTPNQGIQAIRKVLTQCDGRFYRQPLTFDVFETRLKDTVPGLAYDVYVSSGGPGSPYDGEGLRWERRYFEWLDAVWNYNQRHEEVSRKHVLFICHSFQLMCRFFKVAEVVERRSESFGIFPVHMTEAGRTDPLFERLPDPFYAADFRHWQTLQPDGPRMDALGAEVLALEKIRKHVPLERAIMAMRLSPELIGVQFHPEADPKGMRHHFARPERMEHIVGKHSEPKYWRIMRRLCDTSYLTRTHDAVIPNFLRGAVEALRPEAVLRIGERGSLGVGELRNRGIGESESRGINEVSDSPAP